MGVSMTRPGMNGALQALEQDIALAAQCQARILITGEQGVGKAAIARRIHESGVRAGQAFETVSCEGMADWMLAVELFGQAGPGTAGAARRLGAFERAHGGTLFLHGIESLSAGIQARLLRYVDCGEIQPIGADRPLTVPDVRLILSASRPLAARVVSGRFRADLFYRLNVIHLVVPSLRHRGEDILELLADRLRQAAGRDGHAEPELSAEAADRLVRYRWPGNVRELQQVAERLARACAGRRIEVTDLPPEILRRKPKARKPQPPDSRRIVLRTRAFTHEAFHSFALERARAH